LQVEEKMFEKDWQRATAKEKFTGGRSGAEANRRARTCTPARPHL
jgi:hypothetical protein